MARPKQRTAIATLLEDPAALPGACRLPLERIHPNPHQFRRHFDPTALSELAADIRQHGLLEPIIVVPDGDDYMVVAGERHRRAALEADQTTIAAIIRADLSPADAALRMATENLQRQDFTVGDEARMYQELKSLIPPPTPKERDSDGRLSNRALADYLHIAVSRVDRALQLLRHPDLLTQVEGGSLTLRAALDTIRQPKALTGTAVGAPAEPQVRHGDALVRDRSLLAGDPPATNTTVVTVRPADGVALDYLDNPPPSADRGDPNGRRSAESAPAGSARPAGGRPPDPVGWAAISAGYRAIGAIRPEQVPLEVVADLDQPDAEMGRIGLDIAAGGFHGYGSGNGHHSHHGGQLPTAATAVGANRAPDAD